MCVKNDARFTTCCPRIDKGKYQRLRQSDLLDIPADTLPALWRGDDGRHCAARRIRHYDNNLAKETRTVKCAFLSPVPHQCPVDTRVQFR